MNDEYIREIKNLKPTAEDQRKLHAEINQLANQVIMLNVSAIAISGGSVVAVLSKYDISSPFPKIIPLASIAMLAVLFSLYYAGYTHFKTIRFIASYLIYTRSSVWEQHYHAYYVEFGRPRFLYSESRAIIFFVLGLVISSPLMQLFFQKNGPWYAPPYVALLIVAMLIYFVGVVYLGVSPGVHHSQRSNLGHWRKFFGETVFKNTRT